MLVQRQRFGHQSRFSFTIGQTVKDDPNLVPKTGFEVKHAYRLSPRISILSTRLITERTMYRRRGESEAKNPS